MDNPRTDGSWWQRLSPDGKASTIIGFCLLLAAILAIPGVIEHLHFKAKPDAELKQPAPIKPKAGATTTDLPKAPGGSRIVKQQLSDSNKLGEDVVGSENPEQKRVTHENQVSMVSKDIPSLGPVKETYQKFTTLNGFLFELHSCVLRGQRLTCNFTIMNDDDSDRPFHLDIYWGENASRIYDELGNEYVSQRGQLASESGTPGISGLSHTLVSRIKTTASLQFDGIHSAATTAKVLRVSFHCSPTGGESHADFTDVPLQKQ